MSGSSGDDNDSRTAAFTQQRNRANGSSNHSSRNSSQRPSKRQRRARRDTDESEVNDFVPRGATFSANSLEVDPDSTSSSGSDSEQDANKQSQSNPYAGTTAQAVNWNQGNRRAIRTTLGGRKGAGNNNQKKPEKPEENKSNTQFETVNGVYWRSHSASASSGDGHGDQKREEGNDTEEGELHESETAGVPPMDTSGDSDDSESLDSKADESIMLNIGSRPGEKANGQVAMDEDDDYDPESHQVLDISFDSGPQNGDTVGPTKEGAIRNFSLKYPTAPAVMLDLVGEDKNIQSRFWYWKRIEDFQAPVSCTECLQEGHIAQVCPSKECAHCGAWDQHSSNFCPTWRRCQRCRERGHDEPQCSSLLKSSASEVPCDLCRSEEHLELECDYIWKLPLRDASLGPVLVSVSCAHCMSNKHLLGDCPSLRRRIGSSSWTLQGVDPNNITNINSVIPARRGGGPMSRGQGPSRGGGPSRGQGPPRGQRGLQIRGRADPRSPSPDSDEDMLARPDRRPPLGRPGRGRGNIRISGEIGRGQKNQDPDYDYSDEDQRSPSPSGRSDGGRGRDTWNGRFRSQPRGRGRPPPAPRGGGGRGRGRGRGRGGGVGGGSRGGGSGGDAYRPLPSSGKKAWDRYRY